MRLTDSLKAMRRGIYVHGHLYRTAIIAPGDALLSCALHETKSLLEASSLQIERHNRATMTIQTERGGIIRFFRLADSMDTLAIRGVWYPHVIMLGSESDYRRDVLDIVRAQNRGVEGDASVLHWVDDI